MVRLHGHLQTLRRFLILLPTSLPLWLFGWCLIRPHFLSGFFHFPIIKKSLLPGFLPWVCWGTMHCYDMPILCHLNGMWLSHLGVMPHNVVTFSLSTFLCLLDLPVTMLWRCVIPTLGYPPLLHNTGTCLSLARQRFSDFSTLAPHLLVTWFSSVRHNLVVYASTVNILSLLVFCDGNSALLFIRTLVWEGEIFVLYNPNQMWVQCFFFLLGILLYRSVLWVHLWCSWYVICIGVFLQSC